MKKTIIILGTVILLVSIFLNFRLISAINEGIRWNMNAIKANSQAYIDEYDAAMSLEEKTVLIEKFSQQNYEYIKSVEEMSQKSILFRKYHVEGFSDLVLTIANDKDVNSINEKSQSLAEKCAEVIN